MLHTGCRILDRFAHRFDDTGDDKLGLPCIHIDVEVYGFEDRGELVRTHRSEDPPHRRHIFGFLACHDLDERIALLLVGAFVDDNLHGAIALVYRAGPAVYRGCAQAVKLYVAEMPFLYLVSNGRAAAAVRRQRVELAWAAIRAVAVGELLAVNLPVDVCHGLLREGRENRRAVRWGAARAGHCESWHYGAAGGGGLFKPPPSSHPEGRGRQAPPA